jgi:hypothetical protein
MRRRQIPTPNVAGTGAPGAAHAIGAIFSQPRLLTAPSMFDLGSNGHRKWRAIYVRHDSCIIEISNLLGQEGANPFWPHYSQLATDCSPCTKQIAKAAGFPDGCPRRHDYGAQKCPPTCKGIKRGTDGRHLRRREHHSVMENLIFIYEPYFDRAERVLNTVARSAHWWRNSQGEPVVLDCKDIVILQEIRERLNRGGIDVAAGFMVGQIVKIHGWGNAQILEIKNNGRLIVKIETTGWIGDFPPNAVAA